MKRKFNGRAMAEARKSANMNQAELARRVGRNRVSVSDIERGKFSPSRKLAEEIAQILEVNLDSLYMQAAQSTSDSGGVSMTIEELQVIDAMRRLSHVGRAKIWAFAQGLAAGGGSEGAMAAAELTEAIENASGTRRAKKDSQAGSA